MWFGGSILGRGFRFVEWPRGGALPGETLEGGRLRVDAEGYARGRQLFRDELVHFLCEWGKKNNQVEKENIKLKKGKDKIYPPKNKVDFKKDGKKC